MKGFYAWCFYALLVWLFSSRESSSHQRKNISSNQLWDTICIVDRGVAALSFCSSIITKWRNEKGAVAKVVEKKSLRLRLYEGRLNIILRGWLLLFGIRVNQYWKKYFLFAPLSIVSRSLSLTLPISTPTTFTSLTEVGFIPIYSFNIHFEMVLRNVAQIEARDVCHLPVSSGNYFWHHVYSLGLFYSLHLNGYELNSFKIQFLLQCFCQFSVDMTTHFFDIPHQIFSPLMRLVTNSIRKNKFTSGSMQYFWFWKCAIRLVLLPSFKYCLSPMFAHPWSISCVKISTYWLKVNTENRGNVSLSSELGG